MTIEMYMCLKSINHWELQVARELQKSEGFRDEYALRRAYKNLAVLRDKLDKML